MNFEDVEELKNDFALYSIPAKFSTPQCTTFLMFRKKTISYTRIYKAPPVYGAKQNLKMLLRSLLSKLTLKHN